MIRATGSKTDYSPSARAASLSTLHAFLLKGATTFELGKVDISHFGLQKLITENPVAATAVFKALMETVWSCLLGVEPDRLSRRTVPLGSSHKGIFGDCRAWYAVTETQGRLSLHSHMVVWAGYPLTCYRSVRRSRSL